METDFIAPDTPLHALALVCTSTPSPEPSSSVLLAEQVLAALVPGLDDVGFTLARLVRSAGHPPA